MKQQSHCNVFPARLKLEKQLAIARYTLAVLGTPEAVTALEQMELLASLSEPALCAACEVSP